MTKYLGWKAKKEAKVPKAPRVKSPHMKIMKRIKDHIAKSHYLVAKRESEQTTANVQLVRGQTKESAKPTIKVVGFIEVAGRFLEKAPGNNQASARVVLIEEGLGNLGDGYFYTREALQSAADQGIFEGKKMYADHPSKMEEAILPERSTRDIVGHYEDVQFESTEDGSGMLTANLMLLLGEPFVWVHTLVERAVDYAKKYTDKQFIGLSINASGNAEPMDSQDFLSQFQISDSAKIKVEDAINQGLNEIKVVREIQDAVSVDLVTEAGAKGKILELLEANKMARTKEQKIKEAAALKQSAAKKLKEAEAAVKSAKGDAKKLKEAEEAKKEAEKECKEAEEAEAKAKEADDGDGGDGGDDHDDEDADKALIMQMLKKQGLIGDDDSEEECKEAMEAGGHYMAAFKQAGHEPKEAAARAAEAMKCAAAVHAAMNPPPNKGAGGDGDNDQDDNDGADTKSKNKEAKAMIELRAEVARLRESVRENQMDKYLDKKLNDTKLPMRVTALIRESVEGAKTEKEIDKGIATFMKIYKSDREEGFVTALEKQPLRESDNKSAVSFDDCIDEQV